MRKATCILIGFLAAPLAWAAERPPEPKQVRAAVDGALRWLAAGRQVKDGPQAGSWRTPRYRTAVASLAGLAFLANGHLPGKGEYGAAVDRAMRYVQASMTPDGYLGARDQSGMYIHAMCTLFGLSYLGMSEHPEKEKELAVWCRKSVALILKAQKVRRPVVERGGWRYMPTTTESDLSVTSWQILVLHAARQCGYEVEQAVFDDALRYVNRAFVEEGGAAGFLYRPGVSKSPEPGVTGAAVFIKSLLETKPDDRMAKSLRYLSRFPPAWGGRQYNGYFFFGTFYMAEGMFQLGGAAWRGYAPKLQRVLIQHQAGDGHWGFPPDNKPQSRLAGAPYATAMGGSLILSLDKQYLPMYQRQRKLFGGTRDVIE